MDEDLSFILLIFIPFGLAVSAILYCIFPSADPGPSFEQRCHDRGGVVLVNNTECVKSDQLERIVID